MDKRKIYYFDNNATTRIAPEVVEAMMPYLTEQYGNPSSAYQFGKAVGRQVEVARTKVAALVNAEPREIVFTSCGTESNNTAIHSALLAQPGKRHIVTTAVEHSAVLKTCQQLAKRGVEVTFLPVEADGSLDIHLLEKSIRPDTALVSVMLANNETGVVFPLEEIAAICRSKEVLIHTDAVQTPGKMKLDVGALGVDMLSLSAHKLHAPKGIGMLYVKRGTKYLPHIIGGTQEQGRRGGTENVPYIMGFGRAAELALSGFPEENTRIRALRDRMEKAILGSVPDCYLNGGRDLRLGNTSNIAFDFVEAEGILMLLDQVGICASSGSACTTGSLNPSHVLLAMGLTPARARGSIRLSLGTYNTSEEVDYLVKHLPGVIAKLRAVSPAPGAPASAANGGVLAH